MMGDGMCDLGDEDDDNDGALDDVDSMILILNVCSDSDKMDVMIVLWYIR